MSELLFVEPIFKENIWGGNVLKERYGYDIPSDKTGECWAISGHQNGECKVSAGQYAGQTINTLWTTHPELFGNEDKRLGQQFPLLIKIIDAQEDLSIQVHPNDSYANKYENGSLGKTECWYILDCKPNATIVIGHNAKDKEEVKKMIEEERFDEFIREVPIKKGDFFQINPGCVHAIKGGTLILETQQSSDITYRVYDYDRLSNGKLRELHIKQSIEVIKAPYIEEKTQRRVFKTKDVTIEHLVECEYYVAEKYQINGMWQHKFRSAFTNVTVLEGEGKINGIPIQKGQHFIVPFNYDVCCMEGDFTIFCSWPSKQLMNQAKEDKKITIEVKDWLERQKAQVSNEEFCVLAMEDIYEEGDFISVTVPQVNQYYVIRIESTMDESLVYITEKTIQYQIPFNEKRKSYNKVSFAGTRQYITCRRAKDYEVNAYRNLAKNVMDQSSIKGCYPHASANIETRGESVFAARNAIDGVVANLSHGSWPYESWGINKQEDAKLMLEFGTRVQFDKIVIWTRADFPHDSWWRCVTLEFSDGTIEEIALRKTELPQEFFIERKDIEWIKLRNLIKTQEDDSPYPALTQIEVYGTQMDK